MSETRSRDVLLGLVVGALGFGFTGFVVGEQTEATRKALDGFRDSDGEWEVVTANRYHPTCERLRTLKGWVYRANGSAFFVPEDGPPRDDFKIAKVGEIVLGFHMVGADGRDVVWRRNEISAWGPR